MSEIKFREWTRGDLRASVAVAKRAWPDDARAVPAGFNDAYIELYRRRSTWTKTVTAYGEPIGFIFGRVERDVTVGDRLKEVFGALRLIALGGFGSQRRGENRLTLLGALVKTEAKIRRVRPAADAEIALLFLAPEYQGRGIGAALVRNFIEAAGKGAARLIVFTDETSNWRFYEHLGFHRVNEFVDDFESFLIGRPVKGFTYMLRSSRAR